MSPWSRNVRHAFLSILAFTSMALAGCAAPDDLVGDNGDDERLPFEVQAPWWKIGKYWDVTMTRGSQPAQTFRLVNFDNDSATSHFWLGITDRDGGCPGAGCGYRNSALDHALHDNNPIMGRIHWELLTPHEKGIHAHGMYTFPTGPGDEFNGLMFGREWTMTAENGTKPGQLVFKGKAGDGAKIEYDYVPANEWFSYIQITGPDGGSELRVDVKATGQNAKGTYWFLRGRDYYLGPSQNYTHDEFFTVKEEEKPCKSVALEIKGKANGFYQIEVKDPAGVVKQTYTLPNEYKQQVIEVGPATLGKWTITYTGAGTFDGTIEAVGIIEYTATL